jgi:ferredoxin/flavodoxin---NADP+ reductase
MSDEIYDITIIGGGPIGMFAGFYAGMRTAKFQIIESLSELGGQVNALYPEKTLLDIPAYPNLKGRNLVSNLKEQLSQMDGDIKLNQTVLNVEKEGDLFKITTNQSITKTKSVILAAGNGSFTPRKLNAEGVDKFEGQQLVYTANDLQAFKNKTVLVAGGGDSAIDQALMLEDVAKKVYLLHRRNEFRGLERMVARLKQSSVELVTPYLIKSLSMTDHNRVRVHAKKMKTKDEFIDLDVDKILVNYGFISNNKAMQGWKLQFENKHHMTMVGPTLETDVHNIYTVGDQAQYDGKQTIIATGFGEVPIAINAIMQDLYPGNNAPVHSTQLS